MNWNNIAAFFALILWLSAASEMLTSVDPPTDLQVTDLGHLGPLHISWKAPLSLTSKKLCAVRYMLSYCNVDSTNCKRVITTHLEYTDGFNLNKGIQVKLQTLVKEHCTNGTERHSDWVETVYWPLMDGHADSKVRDLQCVVYNLEYMNCVWQNGMSAPHDIKYRLYYWHEDLQDTMECDNYIENQGNNVGCHFHSDALIEFSDFNICINGSSAMGPVRPAYYTLQLQDLVKVAAPDLINLTSSRAETIYIQWEPPVSKIKAHCLKYEVQFHGKSTNWQSKIIPDPVTSTTLNMTVNAMYCVRVRATVNIFCADESIWSDWSSIRCLIEHSESDDDTTKHDIFVELIVLTALMLFVLMVCFSSIYTWIRWKRLIAKKKPNMLLNDDIKDVTRNVYIDC